VGAEVPCTSELMATAAVSHGQHIATPTAGSRLTCQHGGEQSSLVTLTFYPLTLKVVSESRVTWATSVQILKIIGKEFQKNCYKTIFRKINTEEIFSNLHSLQIKTIFQEKSSLLSRYM